MNFKNINKFIIFFLPFFLLSCNSFEITDNKKKIIKYNEIKEENSIIDIIENSNNTLISNDYYNVFKVENWNINKLPTKIGSINLHLNKKIDVKPLTVFIDQNKLILLNYKSELQFFNINDFKLIDSFKLNLSTHNDLSFPTSIAKYNNTIYASYSDGKIINFDYKGNINWAYNFNDIVKTPIKIHNNSLIVLLSDKILSIDLISNEINWQYVYKNEKPLNSYGGELINTDHLLFFVLPNNMVGSIDTVFGDKNESIFQNIEYVDSYDKFIFKLNSYKNIISYFNKHKYLTSIDIIDNKILLENKKIDNVNSFIFFNNVLFTYHKENTLKARNIINNNLFWEIQLDKIINIKDKIISISTYDNFIILFFQSGKVIEINPINGELLSHNKLKIKNITNIISQNKYYLFYQDNGKITIFKK